MAAGGAQRVASILCSHWAELGHDITLITFEHQDTKSFYDLHPNICYKRLNLLGGSGHALRAISSNLKRVMALKSAYKNNKPDIVISFMPENNVLAILSAIGLSRVPILVSERSDPRYVPAQKMWRILRRITYPFAKTIICQTPRASSFFTYHKQCVILPNPISPPSDASSPPLCTPFISGLGRLGHEKGFDILIEAFAKIKKDFPSHHLIILGEGQERQALEQQIKILNLEGSVHLSGKKSQPFSILRHSGLFVMPSRFEGFPNALCEAMTYGLPVIASDDATQSLSVIRHNENSLVFESENINALAAAMTDILKSPEKAQMLGDNARDIVSELSIEKVCAQWDIMINQCLEHK